MNKSNKYSFADQECEIGIDEAGRGPVLGNALLSQFY